MSITLVLAVMVGAMGGEVRAAVDAPPVAARHTAAVFAYRWMHGRLQPYKAFNAVVLNSRYILTAADVLRGVGRGMVKRGEVGEAKVSPVRMYAVVRGQGDRVVVRCRPTSVTRGPLTALEVNAWDRARLEQVLSESPSVGSLTVGSTAQAVGTLIPFGLYPGELGGAELPTQIGLDVEITSVRRSIDGPAVALIEPTLPEDLIGGGLWNRRGELIGILTRAGGKWRAVAVEPMVRALAPQSDPLMRDPNASDGVIPEFFEAVPFLSQEEDDAPLPSDERESRNFREHAPKSGGRFDMSHGREPVEYRGDGRSKSPDRGA